MMKLSGRAWKFGSDVDTDVIIPGVYLNTTDPKVLAAHCMEGLAEDFSKRIHDGDMIVAGNNFGCGSSREHAPLALKACGLSCVIAKSFSRLFFRNSINIGMPIFESPEAVEDIEEGEELVVLPEKGVIQNISKRREYLCNVYPDFIGRVIVEKGLLNLIKKKGE